VNVAIVTGASHGIGAGLVAGFRGAGYAVVGTSRSGDSSKDPDFLAVPGDIAEPQTAERVLDQALGRFGRIDTLVNNAGVFIAKPFTDYTLDDYAMATAANLAGFFHITQRAIRQMVAQGAGRVVNITASLIEHAHSRSPSALAALTKAGWTPSPARWPRSTPQGLADRRIGEIGDIVDAILYLEAATFVTGETLHVDGGRAAGH
jgi:NAD(P)-dependent dehydrogenase (short-subunit alcohol dehydrogenase family)